MGAEPSILLSPAPAEWGRPLGAARVGERAARFREQLGLPRGPLVMSGHQAEFWHMGILAKWLAAAAAAKKAGAAWAWVVVDQDDNDPWRVRVPVRRRDGTLAVSAWTADPADEPAAGRATGFRPSLAEVAPVRAPPGLAFGAPSISAGLEAIAGALARESGTRSAAAQVTGATLDLLAEWANPDAVIYASDLARTDLFAELASRAASDAERCVRAYNSAAGESPGAGVRALERDAGGEWEVPWWRIGADGRRVPARAGDLGAGAGLAPRALMMTGLLRMCGCDLFVHGTGGGVYDAITERWMGAWLGAGLAPAVVASATRLLPLGSAELPPPEEIARLRHHAHAAAHNPALLGDAEAASRKRALLAEIEAGARPARREAFGAMHEWLAGWRRRRAGELEGLRRRASEAASRTREAAIIHDRTWAFPLHPRGAIDEMAGQVRAAFGV